MRFTHLLTAGLLALSCATGHAVSSVSLDFNGGAGGVADTGFEGVYNLDASGYTLGGGNLTITTLPGDIFGNYENDPDDAKNVFYSTLDADPIGGTTVDTKVTVRNLNQNFHGGGIWLGTDNDHYIRLGVIHNGGIVVEALRENEDLWPVLGGPGGDIIGRSDFIMPSPMAAPLDVYLRLVRDGSTAQAFYSLDGLIYNQVNNFTFDAITTGLASGATVEPPGTFKVGVYAFGGGANQASVSFDYLNATGSTAIPEPSTALLLLGGMPAALAALRRRAR